ncbi:MAG TPA: nucleotidyltransferase family protein [Saprospiraceae bacterium]|nr:nucleotidyltransferase family protein [Saprospiraceae bacterium]
MIYGPFPDKNQKLLLYTALKGNIQSEQAWIEWRKNVDFQTDVDWGSYRLLPLVYHNLKDKFSSDPIFQVLKGIYRKTWSSNHILLHKTEQLILFMEKLNIPVMVLKGVPLLQLYYNHVGLRPMSDIDLMVPVDKINDTLQSLFKEGWKLKEPQHFDHLMKYGNSIALFLDDDTELDLHWRLFWDIPVAGVEQTFWENAMAFQMNNTSVLTLCPTDTLFHTLVHGMRANPAPPIRWISDAFTILNHPKIQIDWNRIYQLTINYKAGLPMKHSLKYLVKHFKVPIPNGFLNEISKLKPEFGDRFIYNQAILYGDLKPVTIAQKFRHIYSHYLRISRHEGFIATQLGFIQYLYQVKPGKGFPGKVVRKISSKLFSEKKYDSD